MSEESLFSRCFLKNMDKSKFVSLTFDDGPNCTTTVRVLDVLKEFGVRASFFLIGQNICKENHSVILRQLEQGCSVECHSWTHSHMAELSGEQIKSEIQKTCSLIQKITGKSPAFFRPPYIDLSPVLFESVDLPFICGSDCRDWQDSVSYEQRAASVLKSARNGQIFLLHDSDGNEKTVRALKIIIPALKERGYTFVTLPELFNKCGTNPFVKNKIFSNAFD